jgi:hypothetical protein
MNPRPLNPFQYQSKTPLAIALKHDHQETAELLARADGVDHFVEVGPHEEGYGTYSVLALAIRRGYEDVALVLLDNRDLEPGSSHAASDSKIYDSLSARSSNNDSGDEESINNMCEDTDDARSSNSNSEDVASRNNDDTDGAAFGNSGDSDGVGSIN